MREILFRGKRLDNGKWVEGYYASFEQLPNSCIYYVCKGHTLVADVDPETVCQYTGLADKNGTKIFEWDIVKTSQYGVDDGNGHNYAGFDTFSVEFSDGSFCLKNKWRRFNLRPQRDFEVIDNIFGNPKLIGE